MRLKAALVLVSDNKMKELNRLYRQQFGSTDVLSFEVGEFEDVTEDIFLLGEVVINQDLAKQQAREHGHSFEEEVAELFKHGVLHLLGEHHPGDE